MVLLQVTFILRDETAFLILWRDNPHIMCHLANGLPVLEGDEPEDAEEAEVVNAFGHDDQAEVEEASRNLDLSKHERPVENVHQAGYHADEGQES